MTSNHVPLISAFKMTFKTWDFRGVLVRLELESKPASDHEREFEGEHMRDLESYLGRVLERVLKRNLERESERELLRKQR